MNEAEGLAEINAFLNYKITEAENTAIASIITTMSYSKVSSTDFQIWAFINAHIMLLEKPIC